MNNKQELNNRNKTFLCWFEEKIAKDDIEFETIKCLSYGSCFDVIYWNGYDINMSSFYKKSLDDKSIVQNTGVIVVLRPCISLVQKI